MCTCTHETVCGITFSKRTGYVVVVLVVCLLAHFLYVYECLFLDEKISYSRLIFLGFSQARLDFFAENMTAQRNLQ